MSDLKKYSIDDQLYFIENFIDHCNPVINKLNNTNNEKDIKSESTTQNNINAALLTQLLN